MKQHRPIFGFIFLTLFCSCVQVEEPPPNIVLILVDDLGWSDLGCYGSSFYETPNIDQLALSGVRFTDFYSASPVCSPTRAAIMTGNHPVRVNITDWIPGQDPKDRLLMGTQDLHQLPLSEITLAEKLKTEGYKTFFAGKWHLGAEGFYPEDQGFEINYGGHEKGSPPGGYYSPYKNPKLEDGPDGEYLTDRLTDESIRFIESNPRNPFFLYLSFYTVHTPIQACKRHLDRFEKKNTEVREVRFNSEREGRTRLVQSNPAYASMIYALDENVGRIMAKLEECGIKNNTAVIFTSDNGGLSTLFPHREAPTANLPLRAGKGWCYEGGIRVPLIVSAPGVDPGRVESAPAISMDLFPTVLEIAGVQLNAHSYLDGYSLLPVLKQQSNSVRDTLIWHFPHYHGSAWTPGSAIRKDQWKLIEFYETDELELYDLSNDLKEQQDLSQEKPEQAQKLQSLLHQELKEMGARWPEKNPDYQE